MCAGQQRCGLVHMYTGGALGILSVELEVFMSHISGYSYAPSALGFLPERGVERTPLPFPGGFQMGMVQM